MTVGSCVPATAQEAVETAQILSGSGAQGKAMRSLGAAISGSINAAANTVGAPPGGTHRTPIRNGAALHRGRSVPAAGDVLEETDAPAYRASSGATIRVTGGGFTPGAGMTCTSHCGDVPSGPKSAP
ncbi:hypothetical protein H7F51_08305 [Novosphingobium flavum]|uniref:Uncharacterized protein n=1 Tax=Novosphingobium flavum TaxID=1778672 RepID=A0A7X1FS95_9SPHN|nr:hypothetical protein [Novosphingobium flavum]MBC2665522.1 hypothetical protein [Novosphingobium flavum]